MYAYTSEEVRREMSLGEMSGCRIYAMYIILFIYINRQRSDKGLLTSIFNHCNGATPGYSCPTHISGTEKEQFNTGCAYKFNLTIASIPTPSTTTIDTASTTNCYYNYNYYVFNYYHET